MFYLFLWTVFAWIVGLCAMIVAYVSSSHAQPKFISLLIGAMILGAIGLAGVVIPTFVVTQALQGSAIYLLAKRWSVANMIMLAVTTCLLGLLSFEAFDWLVLDIGVLSDRGDPDWAHGLTIRRAIIFVSIQAFLTAFSSWRLHATGLLRTVPASKNSP